MYQELSAEDRRVRINTTQALTGVSEAELVLAAHRGAMVWRTRKGRDYLYRLYPPNKGGRRIEKSLGPRNLKTERIEREFRAAKAEAEARYQSLHDEVLQRSLLARAMNLGRVPKEVAGICRLLGKTRGTGRRWCIVGTNALYAYEAHAGVRITSGAEATLDVDVLWDTRDKKRLAILSPQLQDKGFLGLLQEVDKSFRRRRQQPFRAENDRGYLVDLLRPFNDAEILDQEMRLSELPGDLLAQPIRGLEWLVSSPKLREVVLDQNGYPFEIVVPDPRAFVLHKLWLAERDDRDPEKKVRDREQARLVAKLLGEYLADYPVSGEALQQFPAEIRRATHGF